jgi:hypothetical protein
MVGVTALLLNWVTGHRFGILLFAGLAALFVMLGSVIHRTLILSFSEKGNKNGD